MRLLSRSLFREIFTSAALGCLLFTSVLFLRAARPLFEVLVRNSGPPGTIAYLFLLVTPQALPYAIPLGVLIGTLIALSRKSADGEITAMRAAGVPGRAVAGAVLSFAFLGMCAAGAASLWLTPWSVEELYRVQNELSAGQLTAAIQPRVFEERFPDSVLYIREIPPGTAALWQRVFVADLKPSPERGSAPSVTLASEAVPLPDVDQSRIQLALRNGSHYETSADVAGYKIQSFPLGDQALQAQPPPEVRASRPSMEMATGPLYLAAYPTGGEQDLQRELEARIELHQRLALPVACLVLALVGIPLGVRARRTGKSPAVVLTVAVAFLYFMGLVTMIGLAEERTLPVELALWLPNLAFGLLGGVLMLRMERARKRDYLSAVGGFLGRLRQVPGAPIARVRRRIRQVGFSRLRLLPGMVDSYLTARFLLYFGLALASFVLLTHVFTFFELLSDIIRNQIPFGRVFTYLYFLTPRLVYETTPVSVLVSVLVVFGVLTKDNEVTAFRACGVSIYRLTVPILITSLFISGALFAFNHYVVPEADRRQDAIRAEIKGRPAQTFLNPDRRWIYGMGDRIFYYRYFDQAQSIMVGVNVFEIDPGPFRLKRHIAAERARWEPSLGAWVFQDGWSRDMEGDSVVSYDNFSGQTRVFPELEETPEYFLKEAVQSQMMNFEELRSYIDELRQSGFDTVPLQVQFYKKFSVPLFALILALVSIPFAFQAGNRGAMAGVGAAIAIFILYSFIGQGFEQMGNLSQLPPAVAAWSPDVVFSLAGLYLLARLRS